MPFNTRKILTWFFESNNNIKYLSGFICSVVLLFLSINYSYAATTNCSTGGANNSGDYRVSLPNTTVPNTGSDFNLLYSVNAGNIPAAWINCTGPTVTTSYTLTNIPAGQIYTYNGQTIYPTSVRGIGVSITENVTSSKKSIPAWPGYVDVFGPGNSGNEFLYFNLQLWKTPGYTPSIDAQDITSFTVVTILRPANYASDNIYPCPGGSSQALQFVDGRSCALITRRIAISTSGVQLGTCDLQTPNQIVQMGTYHYQPYGAPWVDASFQLKCPQAWGFGGSTVGPTNYFDANNGTNFANTTKNKPIKIQISPITPIIDPLQGIFSLQEGGAQGYGIQLAWGAPAAQSNAPSKPVPLGTWVSAYLLNSNYSNTAYAFGATAVAAGADGKIPMSARYVRTSQNTQPGVANASVEVLATYE